MQGVSTIVSFHTNVRLCERMLDDRGLLPAVQRPSEACITPDSGLCCHGCPHWVRLKLIAGVAGTIHPSYALRHGSRTAFVTVARILS